MRTRRSQSSSDLVPPSGHQSVLLHEAIENLAIQPTDTVVDATLGGAGHAKALAHKLTDKGVLIGFDLDARAIARGKDALSSAQPATHLIEGNFRNIKRELQMRQITSIDRALFDLGWSSYQLSDGRGFSFQSDEPLLMTYSMDEKALTARQIVNEWEEESIADVIYGWGEERYSRRIAKAIVFQRKQKPFDTSVELAECIKSAVPPSYRHGRIHPATRTFQALRIAVNDELGALKDGLQGAWHILSHGGRIAVITFHSVEDRLVKQQFMIWENNGFGTRITKKPLIASEKELHENPRARSAKLRVISKI